MDEAFPPHGTYAPSLLTRIVLTLSQNTPLGRGKARKMMAACVRRLSGQEIDTTLFGQNVRLHMHNNSSEIKALMNPRKYSRAEFAFCRCYLPQEAPVFVDVGANAGLFSLGMVGHMRSGKLIAAEPQPDLFERLSLNLRHLNAARGPGPEIYLHNIALGAEAGTLSLSVPEQLGQASARKLDGASMMTVRVRPLLAILQEAELAHVDVMKIDVEGYEDEIILPYIAQAPESLWPRAIVLEHCHRDRWQEDCEAGLIKAGYRLADKDRTNIMLVWDGA